MPNEHLSRTGHPLYLYEASDPIPGNATLTSFLMLLANRVGDLARGKYWQQPAGQKPTADHWQKYTGYPPKLVSTS